MLWDYRFASSPEISNPRGEIRQSRDGFFIISNPLRGASDGMNSYYHSLPCYPSPSRNAFASLRSGVSNPSLNQE